MFLREREREREIDRGRELEGDRKRYNYIYNIYQCINNSHLIYVEIKMNIESIQYFFNEYNCILTLPKSLLLRYQESWLFGVCHPLLCYRVA